MRSLLLSLAALPGVALADYIGAETCKACHPAAYESWKESPHARAELSLSEKSRKDARCTACHAPAAEKGVAAVSCEICHGPGQLYAARHVMRDKELSRAVGLVDPGERTCAACHTESTPSLTKFEYSAKLPLIQHWEERGAHDRAAGPGGSR